MEHFKNLTNDHIFIGVKKILIYSGADQIGDGIIKISFLYYLRKEFPNDKIIWMSNLGTVYKKELNFYIFN